MTKQEEIREETEKHIRACLKLSHIEKDISDSLSKSLMVLLDGLGVVIKVTIADGVISPEVAPVAPLIDK